MGKGDKRTRRGKIIAGSFGKARPHKLNKGQGYIPPKVEAEEVKEQSAAKKTTKKPIAKKTAAKKTKARKEKSE